MKQLLLYLALFSAAAWILALVFAKPHVGYYYPYPDDLTIYQQSDGSVGTFQDCRWWAYRLHQNTSYKDARYACGTKCSYNEKKDLYTCGKITRPTEIDVLSQ